MATEVQLAPPPFNDSGESERCLRWRRRRSVVWPYLKRFDAALLQSSHTTRSLSTFSNWYCYDRWIKIGCLIGPIRAKRSDLKTTESRAVPRQFCQRQQREKIITDVSFARLRGAQLYTHVQVMVTSHATNPTAAAAAAAAAGHITRIAQRQFWRIV